MLLVSLIVSVLLTVQSTSALFIPETKPVVRKEWISLSLPERKEYINAVLCLAKRPSQLPHGQVPGAINRRDDFTAVHINQTFGVHLDAVFLGWHREFLWLYENALRTECGYTGYQPYWDWTKSVNNIGAYPLFDGSEYSISGDGIYDPSTGDYDIGPYHFPHGAGGGCVQSGPMTQLELHLGPIPISALFDQTLPSNWTLRNNHCLRRDFNVPVAQRYTNTTSIAYLLDAPTIGDFQSRLSGVGNAPPGPHTAGHLQIGMDMFDVFSSPNDPAFFFHHSNVDRMWTIWQARDPVNRQFALNGTTVNYDPAGAPIANLLTEQNWGVLHGPKPMVELMSHRLFGFNYVYEDMKG
ncbi:hypothetical protein MMC19_001509 [Ptychographa xylographoides]|nr:hypothetical protein [Ptychographa xylographoides]